MSLLVCAMATVSSAQTLPSGPVTLADGNVVLGGDVFVTAGPEDPGFFNYTDYQRSLLRLVQIDMMASAKAGDHLTLLGQIRSQNVETLDVFALYLRVRPWKTRDIDIQIGRIPPTFGAFSRRAYGRDNPLIGYPLSYQYLTPLRPDSIPANADELLRMRGRGWLSSFSVGDPYPSNGVSLVSASRWDTGVQVHATTDAFEATAALTAGTVSSPTADISDGLRQLAARVALKPIPGLLIGTSFAHGPFLKDTLTESLPGGPDRSSFTQTAWGADVEYARDYFQIRAEFVGSRWRLPVLGSPAIESPLSSAGLAVEGRYNIRPGLFAAARIDRLVFSEITGSLGTDTWDANVTRFEAGGGYMLQRNLEVRGTFQHNTRDTVRIPVFNAGVAQLMFWF
jgi:hypothetical protein